MYIKNKIYETILDWITLECEYDLWSYQTEQPYFFLCLDQMTKSIKICRWGCLRIPRGSDERVWARVSVKDRLDFHESLYVAVRKFDRLYDGLRFDIGKSEKPPKPLLNTKFHSIIHKNFMEMR